MFKKYGHFRQREFKGNWITDIELKNGCKVKFAGKIYLPESIEVIKISLSELTLDRLVKLRLKDRPDLIGNYIRKHFFRSIFYFIESAAKEGYNRK